MRQFVGRNSGSGAFLNRMSNERVCVVKQFPLALLLSYHGTSLPNPTLPGTIFFWVERFRNTPLLFMCQRDGSRLVA